MHARVGDGWELEGYWSFPFGATVTGYRKNGPKAAIGFRVAADGTTSWFAQTEHIHETYSQPVDDLGLAITLALGAIEGDL